jgi:hypothetical protein
VLQCNFSSSGRKLLLAYSKLCLYYSGYLKIRIIYSDFLKATVYSLCKITIYVTIVIQIVDLLTKLILRAIFEELGSNMQVTDGYNFILREHIRE